MLSTWSVNLIAYSTEFFFLSYVHDCFCCGEKIFVKIHHNIGGETIHVQRIESKFHWIRKKKIEAHQIERMKPTYLNIMTMVIRFQ